MKATTSRSNASASESSFLSAAQVEKTPSAGRLNPILARKRRRGRLPLGAFREGVNICFVRKLVKANKNHFFRSALLFQKLRRFAHRDLNGPFNRETIRPSADGREGDSANAVFLHQGKAVSITPGEQCILAVLSITPHRADGVDDPFCSQPITA